MNKITTSAPGKLMLMGEHAVVYNHPCLVTAVGQRIRATVEKREDDLFVLNAPDVKVEDYQKSMKEIGVGEIPKGAKFVEIAVKNFKEKYSFDFGMNVTTSSEFSSQFGFGSSSASTICIVKALSELTGQNLDNKEIFDIAYKTVLDVQGKGSGFDIAAATFGGTLYFVTGGKTIQTLPVASLPLQVGYSGVKADTVTLINKVKARGEKVPGIIENAYEQIEQLVEAGKKALLAQDFATFGLLMDLNQGYLEMMGVSIGKLSAMIYGVRDAGAFGAKLSGAGGGDCMITLAPEDKRADVEAAIIAAGGEVLHVDTNVEGVRVEV
jgi:mevalonate kinase